MRLVYITNGINGSGGLERVLSIKASAFAEKLNYEVHIIVINNSHLNPFYTFSEKIVFHSLNLKGNPFKYFYNYIFGLKSIIKKISPNIILVCDDGVKGFFVPKILRTKIPTIYERHASININTSNSFLGKISKWIMQTLASDFTKFIVLTSTNVKEWKTDNILVIPNPLTFYPEITSSLENKKAIVVGSQSYVKGYDMLLDAWQIASKDYPDWELNCYGKPDKNRHFEKQKDDKGIKNIHFYEAVQSIQDKYLESSFLILPSRSEGFGMVLIEAMACGVPCVAFDCPSGPRDIIKDGEDGFLIEVNNVEEMAQKIIEIIENDKLRFQLGKQSRENVKRYLLDNVIKKWSELFIKLV